MYLCIVYGWYLRVRQLGQYYPHIIKCLPSALLQRKFSDPWDRKMSMMWKKMPIMLIKRKITKRFAQCESMVLMWANVFKYLCIYVCISPYIKKLIVIMSGKWHFWDTIFLFFFPIFSKMSAMNMCVCK